MKTVMFLIATIVAMGVAGITTTILSAEEVDAKSCKDERHGCHGCSTESQGEESSKGKCSHQVKE